MSDDKRETRRSTATETDERAARSRLDDLKAEVDRVASGASLAMEIAGIKTPTRPLGKKSMLVSALVSFLFGPLGWLYAAPLKEAIPAIVVYALVGSLFSWIGLGFLLTYLLAITNVLAAIAGALYAWGFNSAGKRVPLLLKEKDASPPLRKLIEKK
jgi:hypothetical protein